MIFWSPKLIQGLHENWPEASAQCPISSYYFQLDCSLETGVNSGSGPRWINIIRILEDTEITKLHGF